MEHEEQEGHIVDFGRLRHDAGVWSRMLAKSSVLRVDVRDSKRESGSFWFW